MCAAEVANFRKSTFSLEADKEAWDGPASGEREEAWDRPASGHGAFPEAYPFSGEHAHTPYRRALGP
eukprot:CAMPEP_0180146826 /NCGR_PEP_ID=MMETSP0986-20121125/18810_1 /TAXON_ID=697907 /ORGANISM="non described non described, Strain CCMP2293" /LENGTH=66 /DNA_ID=CAMNT_0022092095 /DNA_START=108 /DNA_END=306 /DNA_ORIENTATION=+